MRIGIVCPYSFDVPGGVQNHVTDLAETLIELGHDVSVLAPADDDAQLPPYVVPAGRAVPVPLQRLGGPAAVRAGLGGPGPPLAARRRVRRAARARAADASLSLLACSAARRPDGRDVPHRDDPVPGAGRRAGRAAAVLEKITARIAVSALARKVQVEHLGGDAVEIPNGVAVAQFADADAAARLAGRRAARSASSAGSTSRARVSPVLRDAFVELARDRPGLRLLVAGPGDADDAARASCRPTCTAGSPSSGRSPRPDKARMLRSVDIYVAPNTGGESFGMILTEAMAAGTAGRGQRPRRVPPGAGRRPRRRSCSRPATRPRWRRRWPTCWTTRRAAPRWSPRATRWWRRYDWPGRAGGSSRSTQMAIEAHRRAGQRPGVGRDGLSRRAGGNRSGRQVRTFASAGAGAPTDWNGVDTTMPGMWWLVGAVVLVALLSALPDLDARPGSTGCTPGWRGRAGAGRPPAAPRRAAAAKLAEERAAARRAVAAAADRRSAPARTSGRPPRAT